MAYATGTASDFADLYNKLRDFLTTNVDLVADGEAWVQIAGPGGTLTDADEIILQGPGTTGTDEILVGIKPVTSVASDYYNLSMFGLVSYNPALGGIQSQVGESLARTLLAWNSPMTYWFVANGRRFIVVIKVASTYHMAYCGFILPYMLPTPLLADRRAGPQPVLAGRTHRLPVYAGRPVLRGLEFASEQQQRGRRVGR